MTSPCSAANDVLKRLCLQFDEPRLAGFWTSKSEIWVANCLSSCSRHSARRILPLVVAGAGAALVPEAMASSPSSSGRSSYVPNPPAVLRDQVLVHPRVFSHFWRFPCITGVDERQKMPSFGQRIDAGRECARKSRSRRVPRAC